MRGFLLTIFFLFALQATAQDLPALYGVVGVTSDDELNVREKPFGDAAIVATLSPSAKNIEVIELSDDGRWALLNIGELSGWSAARFLSPQSDSEGQLFELSCFGTEPFWHIGRKHGLSLIAFGLPKIEFERRIETTSRNLPGRFGVSYQSEAATASLIISHRRCSDGMTERQFGYAADLLVSFPAENPLFGELVQYSGCCSLAP